ncbi:4-hydroxy-tetrahydrodipicolinate synthase [uncultured Dialister sp.]|uniref:4-hydroxy-tetrahydrodipicolinate synthase n=1 Tax=uncultured Dialister sp. TaxID=278064 RepID=UPI002617FEEF|nr:4-hydroxy-tetrahydrodipicolinate synthase [uncultured Dialister sp.]
MATAKFGRVITAMITPFHEDGSVDYEGAAALAKHLVAHGSEGILVGGTTGEGATMTSEEKLKLYKTIVDAVGRNAPGKKVPVMGNIGTISTRDTILFGREAKKTGIDCALAIVPFYVKPNQEGMYQHFRAIAKHVDLPIVLYNVPGRTGVSIQPETIKRIVDDCPNVVGIKDATGNWDQVTKEKALLLDDFMIYSGDDAFTLPILAGGGVGVISVASHVIGDDLLAMVDAFEKGDLEKARALHIKMYPIMKGMFFIASPIPVKTAVNLIGQPGGHFRLPIVEPSEEEKNHVYQMLKDYGGLVK